MGFIHEARGSDSPFIETITQGWSVGDGYTIRPAEVHWHMVFVKYQGRMQPYLVGPLTSSGVVTSEEGAEILWIQFKLGAFMPHMPAKDFRDMETPLPRAASNSFWLYSSAWQYPNYNNVETFIERLARAEVLVRDPVVEAALQDRPQDIASRTLRHRFLRATGLTQSHIRQHNRAQQAAALLQRGVPILDAVYELGYFDQPHLTRSLKQFVGFTPAQIARVRLTE